MVSERNMFFELIAKLLCSNLPPAPPVHKLDGINHSKISKEIKRSG